MYVARDEDGSMFLYEHEPQRGRTVWFGGGGCTKIHPDSLPKSINPQWSDPAPIEVKLVRKNK